MSMPDFLVIGAPKAGTTALHAALARHPGLFMSAVKEPKFFLSDGPPPVKGGPGDALTYREHIWRRPEYEALFDPAPPGTLRGESTPLYLYDRAAMRRIRQVLPGARLIVVVRDPVERAHSNWTHLWSAGLEPVGDFVRACGEEERRIAAGWASFWHYTGLGRYGEQLEYLFTLFPREQVLVLRYRKMVDEPAQTLDRICAFLGVEPGVLADIPRQNVTSHPEPTLGHRTLSLAQRAGSAVGSVIPAELGAAPGAHPAVRARHQAPRERARRELPRLDHAQGTVRRHGRRPPGGPGSGQERPALTEPSSCQQSRQPG
jgi:hypothetical protein